jgi:hypothetical protein
MAQEAGSSSGVSPRVGIRRGAHIGDCPVTVPYDVFFDNIMWQGTPLSLGTFWYYEGSWKSSGNTVTITQQESGGFLSNEFTFTTPPHY